MVMSVAFVAAIACGDEPEGPMCGDIQCDPDEICVEVEPVYGPGASTRGCSDCDGCSCCGCELGCEDDGSHVFCRRDDRCI
jgi:hypothetical protein